MAQEKVLLFKNSDAYGASVHLTVDSATGEVATDGNFSLPATSSSSVGVLKIGSANFLHGYGTGNVYIGDAGNFTATGTLNLGIGNGVLGSIAAGSNNVALGYAALGASSDNAYNTAVGVSALSGVNSSTASYNVAIGYAAASAFSSGVRNVAIGANVGLPSNTGDGQLSIQNIIYGTGNTSTTSTVSTGKIGIGVKSPSTKLEVGGNLCTSGAYDTTATSNAIAVTGVVGVGTTTFNAYVSSASTAASSSLSSLSHFTATNASKGVGSTITNQYGIKIDDLTSGVNNYGVYSAVSSGTNKWNAYFTGTALNHFNSRVLIGSNTDVSASYTLQVTGIGYFTNSVVLGTSGSVVMADSASSTISWNASTGAYGAFNLVPTYQSQSFAGAPSAVRQVGLSLTQVYNTGYSVGLSDWTSATRTFVAMGGISGNSAYIQTYQPLTIIDQTSAATGYSNVLTWKRDRATAILQSNDVVADILFNGTTATSTYNTAAEMKVLIDGTPSDTSLPGRYEWYTTPAGTVTPALALKLDSNKTLTLYGNAVTDVGKYISTGSTTADTRALLYGGSGSPTKAVSLNFTNTYDSQGTVSLQRRTSADAFEAYLFGINLSTRKSWIGDWSTSLSYDFNVQSNSSGNGKTLLLRGGSAGTAGDGAGIGFCTSSSSNTTVPAASLQSSNNYGGETNGEDAYLIFKTNQRTGSNTYTGLTERFRIQHDLVASSYLTKAPSSFVNNWVGDSLVNSYGQGSWIGWNKYSGNGEFDFLNASSGSNSAGWFFIDYNTTTSTASLVARLLRNGEHLAATYGSALVDHGVVGASVTLDWRTGFVQRFQTSSATNCTISFTAPSNPCALYIKMVAPASGTTPTLTWPTHKGTALPTSITLGKTRMAHIVYDGTNYVVTSLTAAY